MNRNRKEIVSSLAGSEAVPVASLAGLAIGAIFGGVCGAIGGGFTGAVTGHEKLPF